MACLCIKFIYAQTKWFITYINTHSTQSIIIQELKINQDKILVAERILLQTLSFDLQIDHPYGHLMYLLKSQKREFLSFSLYIYKQIKNIIEYFLFVLYYVYM